MLGIFERKDHFDRLIQECGFGQADGCLGRVICKHYAMRAIDQKDWFDK
jgi:hypothetical protein